MYDVSIIIPVYNCEKYIRDTINSVLNQDGITIEILAIDDCSTDSSGKIINDLSISNKNIRYIKTNKNSGWSSHPRNIGIKEATGRYVMFLDNDDKYKANSIKYIINELDKNKADLCIYSSENVFQTNKEREKQNVGCYCDKDFENGLDAMTDLISNDYYSGCVWIRAIKRELITKNNILFNENIRIYEDDLFSYELMLLAKKTICRNTSIYEYLIRNDSLSAKIKNDIKAFDNFASVYNSFIELSNEYISNHNVVLNNQIYKYIKYFGRRAAKKYIYLSKEDKKNNSEIINNYFDNINDVVYGDKKIAKLVKYPLIYRIKIKISKLFK